MNRIEKKPLHRLGYDFVEPHYLEAGRDEYYFRFRQQLHERDYRSLKAKEIEILVKNANTADDWNRILVTHDFSPHRVAGCQFYGMVRIGALDDYFLEYHDLRLPVGLYNSAIVSCDIGSNVVIDNVRYLAHYIIGDDVILTNVDEMLTTNYAKFGNGIVKDGERESVRIWLGLANENEGRRVAPFDGMTTGDAWLWSRYREDTALMARCLEMTNRQGDSRRGYYGIVGDRTVIKDCRILKDVRIGSDAYIKGANKLKNLTIHSDGDEPSQVGEGVELVNGIIDYGCRVFYGCKAVRFIMGPNSNLKYGARLIHSYLGDNSTISCCEVLNSLIFPSHEQHHNNSFLCAATVLGQSNMAAGVTAGSNHNSRACDGEILAGRGFWPGLCSSLKHNSRFASFTLLSKGAYPAELNITLPFSLVSNDETHGRLMVMPAYWFLYNMYALARNAWKYRARDKRIHKRQMIEFDALAPDTAEEIIPALAMLEQWIGQAAVRAGRETLADPTPDALRLLGRRLLETNPESIAELEVLGAGMESSRRPIHILKAAPAWERYREALHHYCVETMVDFRLTERIDSLNALRERLSGAHRETWVNCGGQLIRETDMTALRQAIASGEINSWDAVHDEYARLWEKYPIDKARHAWALIHEQHGINPEEESVSESTWQQWLDAALATRRAMAEWTRATRAKDYANPFRMITYENNEQMKAVLGVLEADGFIDYMEKEVQVWAEKINRVYVS